MSDAPEDLPASIAADDDRVFITEPHGADAARRYLVACVTPRSMRLFRTGLLWSAMEVRDAWRSSNFAHDPGETRRLPNPKLCVMTP